MMSADRSRHQCMHVVNVSCGIHRRPSAQRNVLDRKNALELRDQHVSAQSATDEPHAPFSVGFPVSNAVHVKTWNFQIDEVQSPIGLGNRIHTAASHSRNGNEYRGGNHQSSIENHSNPREGLFVAPFQFETGYRQPTVQPSVAFPRPKQISAPDQQSSAINRISIFITLAAFRLRGVVSLTAQSSPAASKLGRANAVPLFQISNSRDRANAEGWIPDSDASRGRRADEVPNALSRDRENLQSRLRACSPPERAWPAGVEATPPAGIFSHHCEATAT